MKDSMAIFYDSRAANNNMIVNVTTHIQIWPMTLGIAFDYDLALSKLIIASYIIIGSYLQIVYPMLALFLNVPIKKKANIIT